MSITLKNSELALLGCDGNTGVWYIYKDGEWQELGLKDHSHGGINLDVSNDIKKITRLKIEGGIVTEFEYEE